MFEGLVWQHDRVTTNGLVFRLEESKTDQWELGDECFGLYKNQHQINIYARLLSPKATFAPQHILELGIWEGGSVAFWFECFTPETLVALDISTKHDSDYFVRYVSARNNRIKIHRGVNQEDSNQIRAIVHADLGGALDMVIDDASHLYGPSKASFETLFPLMRPGGLYFIEDWNWSFIKRYHSPDHPWAREQAFSDLILNLVELTGSSSGVIAELTVVNGLVMIERGPLPLTDSFKLEDYISRRPTPPPARQEGEPA
jgi:cephalosporin hydroxylase